MFIIQKSYSEILVNGVKIFCIVHKHQTLETMYASEPSEILNP